MAVLTESQLKLYIEGIYVSLLVEKCRYLELGRDVDNLNFQIKKCFLYWSITDIWDSSMTEDQINCVQSSLFECVVTKTKFDPSLVALQSSPVYVGEAVGDVWGELNVHIKATSGTCDPVSLQAYVFGGVAPYTYFWSCVTGSLSACSGVGFSNPSIDSPTVTGAHATMVGLTTAKTTVRCTVTDSVGNTFSQDFYFVGCV